jgi:hypothetical protein
MMAVGDRSSLSLQARCRVLAVSFSTLQEVVDHYNTFMKL